MSALRPVDGHSPVELVEEALALLRRTPMALAWHLAGAVPFWLGLLWYWTDMTHGALARQRCSAGALVVAMLYLWKRVAQSRLGAWVRAAAADTAPERWSWRDWIALVGLHARCSTWSLLAGVPALLAVAPFGWWVAWHESLTAVCERPAAEATTARTRAWALARSDPAQNHLALGIFSIAAPLAAVNLAVMFAVLPELARTLFGVRGTFSMNELWVLRGSFALILVAATHLLLDAPLKALYAVRAFHIEARRTGADLRAEWRRCRAAALALAAMLAPPSVAAPVPPPAATPTVEEFNAAADRVLARPDFAWRLPRDAQPAAGEPTSLFERALRWLGRQVTALGQSLRRLLARIEEWLRRRAGEPGSATERNAGTGWVRPAAWAAAIAAGMLLVLGLVRHARSPVRPATGSHPEPLAAPVDAETTLATASPSDEWSQLARHLAAAGDLRRAVRAAFLAMLASLAAHGWITVRPARTNRDYRRELERRADVPARLPQRFAHWLSVFERCWYGDHPADRATVEAMLSELETWHERAA
ncbi:MAG: DUF4129 domain-containing protein [Kiritimatiellae bacterium]|nr:DUF4129 domain-containing protein [Kiritimatiellia bacterium]